MKQKICLMIILAVFLSSTGSAYAHVIVFKGVVECKPVYGYYWRSSKWGWYGARKEVRTPVEAKEILDRFIIHHMGIRIGLINETPHFFEAEILNSSGTRVDLLLIDKRTGRMRTIY
jgi:hypothetical protein